MTAGFAYSWRAVLFFSTVAVAVALCVALAPKAFPGISAAALPAIAVLAAFSTWYAGSRSDERPAEYSNGGPDVESLGRGQG